MELIKDNFHNPQSTCLGCGSVFVVSEDDIFVEEGLAYWRCPLCHLKNFANFIQISGEKIKFSGKKYIK